jgi:hypothetical protein
MSNKRVARGISKVINKVHGIDNPEPLQEGKGYSTEGAGTEIKKTPQQREIVKKKINEHLIWDLLQEGKYEEAEKLVGNDLNLMSPDQKEIMVEWRKIQQEKRRQEIRQETMQQYGVTEADVQRRNNILAQRAQLEQMGKNFASGSGPIVSNILSDIDKKSKKQEKQDKISFSDISKFSSSSKKDPQYSRVAPRSVRRVKMGDSEADILAKMFNLMNQEYKEQKDESKNNAKYKKQLDKQKERQLEENITLFTGKGKKKLPPKYRLSGPKSGLLKYGVMGLVAAGGFMITKKAFANINLKQIFDDINNSFFKDENNSKESVATAKKIITSGITSGSKEDQFLAVIRKYEAGTAGYHAINRGVAGDTPKGMPGLENMTVADIMRMQKKDKKTGKGEIFAAGAYQITPDTMDYIFKGMKLTGQEKFDEKMQDEMAKFLISRRVPSFKKFQETGDTDLITQIMKETNPVWAVFVDESTGKSKYEGIAGNKGFIQANKDLRATLEGKQSTQKINPKEISAGPLVGIGDSLGVGINMSLGIQKGHSTDLTALATGGIGPEAVLKKIQAIEKSSPGFFKGKQVILSSGAPNRPNGLFGEKDSSMILEQINLLKSLGATPALLGVGPGDPTGKSGKKIDESGINEKLQKIAGETNIPFIDIKKMFDAKAFDAMGLHLGGSGYKEIIDTVKFLLNDKSLSFMEPNSSLNDSVYFETQSMKKSLMARIGNSSMVNTTNIFNGGISNINMNEYQKDWSAFAEKQYNLRVG